tara:strand:+ start:841 stop:1197 length:357 start_codon:yes stop_codon:yes gene_type:complete
MRISLIINKNYIIFSKRGIMLRLYDQKPISIFTLDDDIRIGVEFCNVKMKMKPCQFRLFHNYLFNISKKLNEKTDGVELLLVKDSLKVSISIDHFFQLFNAVSCVMNKKFGKKIIYQN